MLAGSNNSPTFLAFNFSNLRQLLRCVERMPPGGSSHGAAAGPPGMPLAGGAQPQRCRLPCACSKGKSSELPHVQVGFHRGPGLAANRLR